uniref:Uncharacterized protein n=1 Tax=Solanum lycopersicum TaxID=4081 RepID=A0A3Q7G2V5_SOLLC
MSERVARAVMLLRDWRRRGLQGQCCCCCESWRRRGSRGQQELVAERVARAAGAGGGEGREGSRSWRRRGSRGQQELAAERIAMSERVARAVRKKERRSRGQ